MVGTKVFRRDTPHDLSISAYGQLRYPVFLHEDVADGYPSEPHLRRRLSMVLQNLASMGRTGVMKGCADEENRGWRRTPMGGNQGMQYYLWWTPGGGRFVPSEITGPLGLERSIWVRAIRHHDDHRVLTAGTADSYYPLSQPDITGEDESFVDSPWTRQQREFIGGDHPVRVVYGQPGSGKTTALWRVAATRRDERVLYTSWSRELVEMAASYFRTFAPASNELIAYDFQTFLGMLAGRDIPRLGQTQRMQALRDAIAATHVQRAVMGPWAGNEEALLTEIRGVVLGMGMLDPHGVETPEGLRRLSRNGYLDIRGRTGVDERGVDSLMRIVAALERQCRLGSVFPDLIATQMALNRLRDGHLPEGFADIDRLVLDEVQDLSLIAVEVVIELCRAIGRSRDDGHLPCVVISGDSGQSVTPSEFDWGRLSSRLSDRLRSPAEYGLDSKLRSPAEIAAVLDRTTHLYSGLARNLRPANQTHSRDHDAIQARLFYVPVSTSDDALDLLEALGRIENTAVITPEPELPSWIRDSLKGTVLTTPEAKGLEYATAIVVNPGLALESVNRNMADARLPMFQDSMQRVAVDRLRVAVSRATETLAFVDVALSEDAMRLSRELLGTAVHCSAADLIDYLSSDESTPEDRALARVAEARSLVEADREAAWQRASQALGLLGEPGLPNGVADPGVRRDVCEIALYIGVRILVEDSGTHTLRESILDIQCQITKELGTAKPGAVLAAIAEWSIEPWRHPLDLLDSLLATSIADGWLADALAARYQALQDGLERAAMDSDLAVRFLGDLYGWLRLTGHPGDIAARADELRIMAANTLFGQRKLAEARAVLGPVTASSALAEAQTQEQRGDWRSTYYYRCAGMNDEADRTAAASVRELIRLGEECWLDNSCIEGLNILDLALMIDPGEMYSHLIKGHCYSRLDPEQAMREYTTVIEGGYQGEALHVAYYARADMNILLGRRVDALKDCLASVSLYPDQVKAHTLAAEILSGRRDFEEGLDHAMAAIKADPLSREAQYQAGRSLRALGKSSEALEHLLLADREGLETDTTVESGVKVDVLAYLGDVCGALGEFDDSVRHYSRVIALQPVPHFFLMRSYSYQGLLRGEEALRDLDMLVDLQPDCGPDPYFARYRVLMCMRRFPEALGNCITLLDRYPRATLARLLRLVAAYEAGDFRRALQACRALLRAEPADDTYLIMLGNIYMCMGRPQRAMVEGYHRALDLEPMGEEAIIGIEAARELKAPAALATFTKALMPERRLYLMGERYSWLEAGDENPQLLYPIPRELLGKIPPYIEPGAMAVTGPPEPASGQAGGTQYRWEEGDLDGMAPTIVRTTP